MPKIATYTLGCKLNFSESSHITRELMERGMVRTEEGEPADICIINTCTVTATADQKGRQLIRRVHRENPDALIVVTGCYTQLQPVRVARIDGVDLVLGAEDKASLIPHLERLLEERKAETSSGNSSDQHLEAQIEHTHIRDVRTFAPAVSSEGRTRHFLKVQDGCDYFCTYCTIPMARGRSRNGSIADIVQLAERVAQAGGREIVLTGVNVGDFGRTTGETFMELIQALDQVEGIERFRISSIEPNLITDEMIHFVAESQRFAPHFHLPLQSGSDEVLRLMRRRYTRDVLAEKVTLILEIMPDAFIGLDVMVGCRGELPEYFEDSYRFIEGLPISKVHVFTYSERPGTAALRIKPSVPSKERNERSRRLHQLSDQKLRAFNLSQRGTTHDLLVEHRQHGEHLYGFTENYLRVRVPYDPAIQGEVVPVLIGDLVEDEVLEGTLL